MKITKRQLIRLIKEAMYDPRALPADNIPISMIGVHGKNRKEKLHNISNGVKK